MSLKDLLPEIEKVSERSELSFRVAEWVAFSRLHGGSAPFTGPETWVSWLETHPLVEPAIFELRNETGLLAVLPMYREGRVYRMAADKDLDYQDLTANSPDSAVELLARVIETYTREGFTFTFSKVAEGTRLHAALIHPRIPQVGAVSKRYWSSCPTATFRWEKGDEFHSALSSRQRKDHKSASRRLKEVFPNSFVEHLGEEVIPFEKILAVAKLHRENQHRKGGRSIFADEEFLRFLRRQSENGAFLRLSILWEKEGGAPLAFAVGYFKEHTFYYYLTSYDGRQSELSVGRLLMVETLVHRATACQANVLRLDMLCGLEPYKSRWAKSYYDVLKFQILPKSFAYLPQRAVYVTVYGLKSVKERVLQCLGRDGVADLEHEAIGLTR